MGKLCRTKKAAAEHGYAIFFRFRDVFYSISLVVRPRKVIVKKDSGLQTGSEFPSLRFFAFPLDKASRTKPRVPTFLANNDRLIFEEGSPDDNQNHKPVKRESDARVTEDFEDVVSGANHEINIQKEIFVLEKELKRFAAMKQDYIRNKESLAIIENNLTIAQNSEFGIEIYLAKVREGKRRIQEYEQTEQERKAKIRICVDQLQRLSLICDGSNKKLRE